MTSIRMLQPKGDPFPIDGMVFQAEKSSIDESLQTLLFGMPAARFKTIRRIKIGATIFLYDLHNMVFHGVYEAVSPGCLNLDPEAYGMTAQGGSRQPAQVQCVQSERYPPAHWWLFENVPGLFYAGTNKVDQILNVEQIECMKEVFRENLERITHNLGPPAACRRLKPQTGPLLRLGDRPLAYTRPYGAPLDTYVYKMLSPEYYTANGNYKGPDFVDPIDDGTFTTVVLKNLPLGLTGDLLVDSLDQAGYHLCYDYLMIKESTAEKVGYATINFTSRKSAEAIFPGIPDVQAFWPPWTLGRMLQKPVSWARQQGMSGIQKDTEFTIPSVDGEPAMFCIPNLTAFIFNLPEHREFDGPSLSEYGFPDGFPDGQAISQGMLPAASLDEKEDGELDEGEIAIENGENAPEAGIAALEGDMSRGADCELMHQTPSKSGHGDSGASSRQRDRHANISSNGHRTSFGSNKDGGYGSSGQEFLERHHSRRSSDPDQYDRSHGWPDAKSYAEKRRRDKQTSLETKYAPAKRQRTDASHRDFSEPCGRHQNDSSTVDREGQYKKRRSRGYQEKSVQEKRGDWKHDRSKRRDSINKTRLPEKLRRSRDAHLRRRDRSQERRNPVRDSWPNEDDPGHKRKARLRDSPRAYRSHREQRRNRHSQWRHRDDSSVEPGASSSGGDSRGSVMLPDLKDTSKEWKHDKSEAVQSPNQIDRAPTGAGVGKERLLGRGIIQPKTETVVIQNVPSRASQRSPLISQSKASDKGMVPAEPSADRGNAAPTKEENLEPIACAKGPKQPAEGDVIALPSLASCPKDSAKHTAGSLPKKAELTFLAQGGPLTAKVKEERSELRVDPVLTPSDLAPFAESGTPDVHSNGRTPLEQVASVDRAGQHHGGAAGVDSGLPQLDTREELLLEDQLKARKRMALHSLQEAGERHSDQNQAIKREQDFQQPGSSAWPISNVPPLPCVVYKNEVHTQPSLADMEGKGPLQTSSVQLLVTKVPPEQSSVLSKAQRKKARRQQIQAQEQKGTQRETKGGVRQAKTKHLQTQSQELDEDALRWERLLTESLLPLKDLKNLKLEILEKHQLAKKRRKAEDQQRVAEKLERSSIDPAQWKQIAERRKAEDQQRDLEALERHRIGVASAAQKTLQTSDLKRRTDEGKAFNRLLLQKHGGQEPLKWVPAGIRPGTFPVWNASDLTKQGLKAARKKWLEDLENHTAKVNAAKALESQADPGLSNAHPGQQEPAAPRPVNQGPLPPADPGASMPAILPPPPPRLPPLPPDSSLMPPAMSPHWPPLPTLKQADSQLPHSQSTEFSHIDGLPFPPGFFPGDPQPSGLNLPPDWPPKSAAPAQAANCEQASNQQHEPETTAEDWRPPLPNSPYPGLVKQEVLSSSQIAGRGIEKESQSGLDVIKEELGEEAQRDFNSEIRQKNAVTSLLPRENHSVNDLESETAPQNELGADYIEL